MRKLLLATVAALGASMGAAAVAEAQAPTPAPGTITVRLNGRFRFFGAIVNDRDVDNNVAGTSSGTSTTAASGSNKQSNYTFGNYARLYPGFDGVAANGLKYGASLEIRQDNNTGAGGGTYGSVSSTNRTRGELYFRREWGYLGTNQLGTIRLGSTDSPSSLYMTGNFENFNDGGWNGDVPALMASRTQITWPFADVGATYSTTKAVYLSPQFYGFDFGVGYAPNSGAVSNTNGCGSGSFNGVNFVNPASAAAAGTLASNANSQGVSGPGCDRLSSTAATGELARYKNFVDALVRYRGTFGPVGLAATAAFIGSGKVNDSATPGRVTALTTGAGGAVTGSTAAYSGLKVGDFGVALTYAGFSVGGKYQFGQVNNQWQLNPTGLPDSQAWLVGASYTVGPLVVGAHYLDYQFAGDLTNALQGRQRREKGLAAGATYSLVPGVSLFASYLWGQFQQNGVNQITGQNTGVAGTQNNKLTANAFALGTSFSW